MSQDNSQLVVPELYDPSQPQVIRYTPDKKVPTVITTKAEKKPATMGRMIRALMIEEGLKSSSVIGEDGQTKTRLQRVVERLFDEAELGDMQAIKEIFDRTEGKAATTIEDTGESNNIILVLRGASMDDV